jgi:alkylation response protein AidB-like acyl-CoA dehydrogenase
MLGLYGVLVDGDRNAPFDGEFERPYRAAPLLRFGGGRTRCCAMRSPSRVTRCRGTADELATVDSHARWQKGALMKLTDTDEQRALQEMLADLFASYCPPGLVRSLKKADSDGFPAKLWLRLTEAEALGLAIEAGYGGGGGSLYELGLLFREAGKVLCPTIVYSTLVFGVAVQRVATQEQKKRYLPMLAGGELTASVASWNPADAGDVRPRIVAEAHGREWVLSGELMFVPNGARADVVFATALTTTESEPARVLGFLIEPHRPGWSVEPVTNFAGDKQSRIVLEGYRATEEQVVGAGTDAGELTLVELRWIANAAVALRCMEMVGGAKAVLDRTAAYIKVREQFGRPIAGFQAAQHMIADMRIAVEGARLAASQAVWWIRRGSRRRGWWRWPRCCPVRRTNATPGLPTSCMAAWASSQRPTCICGPNVPRSPSCRVDQPMWPPNGCSTKSVSPKRETLGWTIHPSRRSA